MLAPHPPQARKPRLDGSDILSSNSLKALVALRESLSKEEKELTSLNINGNIYIRFSLSTNHIIFSLVDSEA